MSPLRKKRPLHLAYLLIILPFLFPTAVQAYASDISQISKLYKEATRLMEKKEWEKAKEIAEKAIRKLPGHSSLPVKLVSDLYNIAGDCALDLSAYPEAISYYERSKKILEAQSIPDSLALAAILNKIGNYYREIKDCKTAKNYLEKALSIRISRLGKRDLKVADVYNNIGICMNENGDFEKALQFHQQALAIRSTQLTSPHPLIAQSFNNIGISLEYKGSYYEALNAYQQAFKHYMEFHEKDHPDIADVYVNIGNVYGALYNVDFFLEYQNKALTIYLKTLDKDHSTIALSYNNIANAHRILGEHKKAIKFHQQALAIRKNNYGDRHPDIAESYFNIAQNSNFDGQWEAAIQIFQNCFEALNYQQKDNPEFELINSHSILLNALGGMVKAFSGAFNQSAQLNDLTQAFGYLEQASQLIDFLRMRYETVGSKLKLAEKAHDIYEKAIEIALALTQLTGEESFKLKAFQFSEKSKAILLLEALNKANAESFAGIPFEKIVSIKELEKKIAELEKMSFLAKKKPQLVDSLNQQIFEQKRQLSGLIELVETEYPQYYRLKYETATVPLEEIQRKYLNPDQTIVEYFLGTTQLYIFVINENSFEVVTVRVPDEISNLLHQLNYTIRHYPEVASIDLKDNIEQYATNANYLFEILIQPIEDILKAQLIVIPDGELGLIPFGVLVSSYPEQLTDFKSYSYLIHKYDISYNYSASLLKEMLERKKHQQTQLKTYLGFAPKFPKGNSKGLSALKYNQKEIQEVEKLLGGQTFTDQEATKHNFLLSQNKYKIIHLATHGMVNNDVGDYSFLAFSETQDQKADGALLFVKEIYNTPTRAEMLVLSACDTGIGEMQKGEGIASIARSFSYAGAKSLMATLWNVDDKATSDLVSLFFENIKNGQAKDKALRKAKTSFIQSNSNKKAHPYYWGSFIAIGDTEALDFGFPFTKAAGYFLAGMLIIGMLWGFYRLKLKPNNN